MNRALQHIREECARLGKIKQNAFWPKYVFHTCPIENAIKIVKRGSLTPRSELNDFVDVANQGALHNFAGSHDYARLYFRPKNGFHLRTEGIKCRHNPYRLESHMSIPVVFVFKLEKVITRDGAFFSSGNVQKSASFLTGDKQFDSLDFGSIYHDSAPSPDTGDYVRNMRMSEVSVKGSLPLKDCLQAIMFRTKWDLQTFRYLLHKSEDSLDYRVGVEQIKGSLFHSRGLFISDLSFIKDEISIGFNFPVEYAPVGNRYLVSCTQSTKEGDRTYKGEVALSRPTLNITNYRQTAGEWKIELEDALGFFGQIDARESAVF